MALANGTLAFDSLSSVERKPGDAGIGRSEHDRLRSRSCRSDDRPDDGRRPHVRPVGPGGDRVDRDRRRRGTGVSISRSGASGTPGFRIFYVGPAGNLTLHDLTVSNGLAQGGDGGGGRGTGRRGGRGRGAIDRARQTLTGNAPSAATAAPGRMRRPGAGWMVQARGIPGYGRQSVFWQQSLRCHSRRCRRLRWRRWHRWRGRQTLRRRHRRLRRRAPRGPSRSR